MDIRKEIESYVPFNEQETIDKENFIKFIDSSNDVLTRKNTFGHFSASSLVLDKSLSKAIILYHKIFEGYVYPGGHADGDDDLLHVAIKEVKEETNLDVKPITNDIFAIQILPIKGHVKNGQYISSHVHYDVLYLLLCDSNIDNIKIKDDENLDVKWVDLDKTYKEDIIDWQRPINKKIVKKIKALKNTDYFL
ncbi:MAG: NUDIX domain-containing protein [Bacilli bacterium]|nr:NUDIX domain-containing protein [Bacilli bacterium]